MIIPHLKILFNFKKLNKNRFVLHPARARGARVCQRLLCDVWANWWPLVRMACERGLIRSHSLHELALVYRERDARETHSDSGHTH